MAGFPAAAGDDDGFPQADTGASGTTSQSTSSGKPIGTIPQLADYLINGFWQYNDTIAHHWASSTITYNISGLTAAEQFLAQSALEAWHEVANVTFVQTTGPANITFNHSGTMTAFESDNYSYSGIMISSTVDISADWITNDGGARDGKTGIDSYGYQTYIHEIGHALGLGHQGPYNGSAVYSTNATYADDTWQYSVMSYFAENNYSGSSYRYVVTPQMADIYAVDSIYGAATTRNGDTVYGFHGTAGSIYDFTAYSQAPALTIYDSGGNDTLDCSGYSVAQTIDLHPGSFSSVGGLVHNIGISTTTVIENAIGGGGNDTLIANDLGCTLSGGAGNDTLIGGAGNDTLIGGAGVDTLTGGGGADTFVFATGDSSAATGKHDLITDFTHSIDKIDLSGIDAISTTSADDLFDFIGTAAFDGTAGELDYLFDSTRGVTVLEGDTNGDKTADFAIDLSGNITLSAADIIGLASAFLTGVNTVFGTPGNDVFYVNSGQTVVGGGGFDCLIELTSGVDLSYGTDFTGISEFVSNVGDNTVDFAADPDVAYLYGSTGNDTLTLGAGGGYMYGEGGTNILNGGANATNLFVGGGGGIDTMNGGTGTASNFYYVDGNDQVNGAGAFNAVIELVSGVTVQIGSAQYQHVQEFVAGGGTNAVTVASTDPDFIYLYGGAGNDTLTTGSGGGYLFGEGGSNILTGGGGINVFVADGGSGIDTMNGGSGSNIYFIDANSTVHGAGTFNTVVELQQNVTLTLGGAQLGSNIQEAVLNGGTNTADFHTATDALFLYGSSGNDTLFGGTGNDFLYGGAGTNTFEFASGWGHDTIMAWTTGTNDQIDLTLLSGLGVHAISDLTQTVTGGNDIITSAHTGTNSITLIGVNSALTASSFKFA